MLSKNSNVMKWKIRKLESIHILKNWNHPHGSMNEFSLNTEEVDEEVKKVGAIQGNPPDITKSEYKLKKIGQITNITDRIKAGV